MQRIAEVQGFRQRLADRIQYQELAIAPPDFKFEVGHRAVLLQEFLEPFAVRSIGIKRSRNIYRQQLLAILITGHAKKRIVKIQESSLGRGDKHALLNAGHQRAILFLRALSIRDVFQNVYSSELQSTGIRKR